MLWCYRLNLPDLGEEPEYLVFGVWMGLESK
jgi:hypothetical protein